jgi:hypothetical protein
VLKLHCIFGQNAEDFHFKVIIESAEKRAKGEKTEFISLYNEES